MITGDKILAFIFIQIIIPILFTLRMQTSLGFSWKKPSHRFTIILFNILYFFGMLCVFLLKVL